MNPGCVKCRMSAAIVALLSPIFAASPLFGQTQPSGPSTRSLRISRGDELPASQRRHARSTEVDELLGWLPADTESVIVATGPLPKREERRPHQPDNARVVAETRIVNGKSVLVAVYVDSQTGRVIGPAGSLSDTGPQLRRHSIERAVHAFDVIGPAFVERILQQPIKATVAAARRFGPISGIPGGTPYEGCEIIVFGKALPEGTKIDKSGSDKLTIDEVGITRVDAGRDGKTLLYFAQPMANMLVVATNLDFLATMLRRMAHREPSRALPPELPEWRLVNTRSPVWGVRHASEMNTHQPDARNTGVYGLTFSLEEPTSTIVARYLSTHEAPDKRLSALMNVLGPKDYQPVRAITPTLAEVKFSDNTDSLGVSEALMGWVVAP